MRLACSDHSFPLLPHEVVLDLIAAMGFEGVDLALMGNRSHFRPEMVSGNLRSVAAEITKSLKCRDLELADLFIIPWTDFETMAPNNPDPDQHRASRTLFEEMFELARLLRAPGMTMLPGITFDEAQPAASLEMAAAELQWRALQLKSAGMRFSVECHIGSVASTPSEVLQLLKLAPDVKLTLDYTHFIAPGFTQVEIDELIPYVGHMQVRGARPGRGQCGMRENVIDYEAVIERLGAADYDGFLTTEYVWINWEHMNECDNVSETIMMRDRLQAKLDGRAWQYQGPNI